MFRMKMGRFKRGGRGRDLNFSSGGRFEKIPAYSNRGGNSLLETVLELLSEDPRSEEELRQILLSKYPNRGSVGSKLNLVIEQMIAAGLITKNGEKYEASKELNDNNRWMRGRKFRRKTDDDFGSNPRLIQAMSRLKESLKSSSNFSEDQHENIGKMIEDVAELIKKMGA